MMIAAKRECNMVNCCRCDKPLKAHLADHTLSREILPHPTKLKTKWQWVPICFDCKYPGVR